MTIYSIITIILLVLFLVEQKGVSYRKSLFLFYISAFLVFFIMAFRGENVGGDMIEYVHFWQGKYDMYGTYISPTENLRFEPGLSWLCYFLHIFNDGNAWFFVFWTSFIVLVPFLYLVWRDSYYKVLPLLLYMVLWGLLDISYTGLRQVIGSSLCVVAYIVWTTSFRKRNIKYVISIFLILLSLSFHASVYFCILLYLSFAYFEYRGMYFNISLLLVTLAFGIGFNQIAPVVFENVSSLFTSLDLLFRYNHYFEGSGDADGLQKVFVGAKQMISTFVVCLLIFFSRYKKQNKFYINALVVGCSLFNILAPFPNAGRFLYPYMMVGLIIPLSKYRINKFGLLKIVLALFVIVLSVHQIRSWELGAADKKSGYYIFNQMFPYNFIWEDK